MTEPTRPNLYTLTQDLARECYERYKSDSDDLSPEVQLRWVAAPTPVAERLHCVTHVEQDLEDARVCLADSRTDDRASAAFPGSRGRR